MLIRKYFVVATALIPVGRRRDVSMHYLIMFVLVNIEVFKVEETMLLSL